MRSSRLLRLRGRLITFTTLASLGAGPALIAACSSTGGVAPGPADQLTPGQSDFLSAPFPGSTFGSGAGTDSAGGAPTSAPSAGGKGSTTAPTRTVEETDLYRLDGNRLYYLNSYRGLMVFDVTNVDQPKLLGRSPIFGDPVEMVVRDGIAVVVVGDWYGTMEDGSPFHGSIVRGIDARDPASIKITGEAKLGGWVRDTRVVGDVLYAVSEDYGWEYGWGGFYGGGVAAKDAPAGSTTAGGGTSTTGAASGPKIVISSVSFTGGVIKQAGTQAFDGYSGIFNVTPNAIMLAHGKLQAAGQPSNGAGQTDLQYVDISDPAGAIKLRGAITVDGAVNGWGSDNGRFNLDFADATYAHTIGCALQYCGGTQDQYVLSTVDFSNADAPKVASALKIAASGWSVAARFDSQRLYLSPSDAYYSNGNPVAATPVQIYDLATPAAPKLAGSTQITGTVWNFIPAGPRLFALGNDYTGGNDGSRVTLRYLDVSDAAHPSVLGTSTFGDGWAWTPAAGTFKAFTKDDAQGLVVIPFSGWDSKTAGYNNGVQLISFTPTTLTTQGAAKTKGWVERGIFVKGRLVSLSDTALSVVDYTDKAAPKVVTELTLARNVVNAQPQGATIAQLSSDWYDNDQTSSELRVLPIANAEETSDASGGTSLKIDGMNAQIFRNGDMAYVVSSVRHEVTCDATNGGGGTGGVPAPTGGDKGGTTTTPTCYAWTQQVQVVDLSNGGAVLRGKVSLPDNPGYYYGGWGYYGCYSYDWFNGSDVVQVDGSALAFRRWTPTYGPNGTYEDARNALYVVDASDADKPAIASTTITKDTQAWWGNMRAVGNTLYTTHYDWIERPDPTNPGQTVYHVKYYLDRIDLTDRHAPKVGTKINVPGVLVGASETDPSLLYTISYRWAGNNQVNDLAVVKIDGSRAYLQGTLALDGYVGNVIVKGNQAFMSAEHYSWDYAANPTYNGPRMTLHQVDLSTPSKPVDRVSSQKDGWGWLLDVEGDRAIVTSGWGQSGIDLYKLSDTAAPTYDKFVRTRGWWSSSLARQGSSLYLASGYWGVQQIDL